MTTVRVETSSDDCVSIIVNGGARIDIDECEHAFEVGGMRIRVFFDVGCAGWVFEAETTEKKE